jgi:hypothetical protein
MNLRNRICVAVPLVATAEFSRKILNTEPQALAAIGQCVRVRRRCASSILSEKTHFFRT